MMSVRVGELMDGKCSVRGICPLFCISRGYCTVAVCFLSKQ